MRFDIVNVTRFAYDAPVAESQNELRAAPCNGENQQVVHVDVRTTPSSRVFSTTDYWGTRVDAFGVRAPHTELVVVVEATVETSAPRVMADSPRLSEVTSAFLDEHAEFTEPSSHTAWGPALAAEVADKRAEVGDDLVGFVLAMHRLIGTSCEYVPGATYVGVPLDQVWERRQGVCQDFAHLLVAACRAGGVPARYVSGYLFTRDDATGEEVVGDQVTVQTHAWAEVAIPGYGWWGLDPTNRQQVGERHVRIGHGRDYGDVAPLRGVYAGTAAQALSVEVDMRRAALAEAQVQQSQQQQQ